MSASKAGEVKVWNANAGDEKYSLPKNDGSINSISWSPEGSQIATAGDDRLVRIWNAETGEKLLQLSGHTSGIWSVAGSPDSTQVATASDDGTVRIWDARTGEDGLSIRLAGSAWDVAWSPEGKWLATTAGDGFTLKMWDATPIAPTLSGTQEGIQWVSWSPDGKSLATSALDNTAAIWDFQTGQQLLTLVGHTNWVQDIYWSPDSTRVVTTGWDNIAIVWDAITGEELVRFTNHVGEPPGKLIGMEALFGGGWSPDGSRISTIGAMGTARVWDSNTGEDYFVLQLSEATTTPRWSPDGTRLATCEIPQVLQIWDATTGKLILGENVDNVADKSFGDSVDFCATGGWSPDGKKIFTTSWGGNGATIWDAETGEKILVFKGHAGGIGFSAWSPNGKRITSGDANGQVKIWDAETGNVLLSFSVPIENYLFQLAWSPDGTRLTGAGIADSIQIYRVWQTKEDLIAYAKECCVVRELTPEEHQQFGLP